MSISACDIRVSILFSLLLANHAFFFLVMLSNFFTIPVVREKIKVKLALAIPIAAPATLVNEITDAPPLVALKAIKTLPM